MLLRQKIRQLEQNEPESPRLAGYRGFQKMIEKPKQSLQMKPSPLREAQSKQNIQQWKQTAKADYEDEYFDEEDED